MALYLSKKCTIITFTPNPRYLIIVYLDPLGQTAVWGLSSVGEGLPPGLRLRALLQGHLYFGVIIGRGYIRLLFEVPSLTER